MTNTTGVAGLLFRAVAVLAAVAFFLPLKYANAGPLYASVTDGVFHAVATFSPSLSLITQMTLSGPITGLAAGSNGDFYTATGQHDR
jgi:hypothetical protein